LQLGAGKLDNRLQPRFGLIFGYNQSRTVPENNRLKRTGLHQSSPVLSLFGNYPDQSSSQLPTKVSKKQDQTRLSNTNNNYVYVLQKLVTLILQKITPALHKYEKKKKGTNQIHQQWPLIQVPRYCYVSKGVM
jgi:hypothetical protein